MQICTNCSEENSLDALQCKKCNMADSLIPEVEKRNHPSQELTSTNVQCTNCGQQIPLHNIKCTYCKFPLDNKKSKKLKGKDSSLNIKNLRTG